ncbi:hypothetical protein [Streptomyces sp. AC512_CC834]|uniref:hypothetical protein n=1 Tax=Streptomyces sp. AC512_CC834 TaxID=2823691 RepID=UPI001C2778FC|nr:hypothetical protein [Streptomyces sp. AC512_CC834]
MTNGQVQDRIWAILATVADGRQEDIEALLDDLEQDDLGHVVAGIAALAVGFLMPRGTPWTDIGRRGRVAAELRAELLHRATPRGPDSDDSA